MKVIGRVIARPVSNTNLNLETGEIEVFVEDFQILEPDEAFTGSVKTAVIDTVREEAAKKAVVENQPTKPVVANVNQYVVRTYTCGELTEHNIGETVTLVGWLEFQRMNKFLTLRDGYGCTQVFLLQNNINISFN